MRVKERRERFRAILEGDRCVATASVYDALTARIAEDLGFEIGVLGGSVASMAVLGAPDLMGLTLTEFAQQIYRICRAGDLSLIVDADDGYGNAINVMRTVEELEAAGTAALSLEDTQLPPPFGAGRKVTLIPREEAVGKMRAALEARSDPGLAIVGRTTLTEEGGLEEAIARLQAYAEAGVDALFPIGIKTLAELERLCDAVDLPIVVPAVGAELSDMAALAARGCRVALRGHVPIEAAMKAVHDVLEAQLKGVANADMPGRPPADFMQRITRRADYDHWTDSFLQ